MTNSILQLLERENVFVIDLNKVEQDLKSIELERKELTIKRDIYLSEIKAVRNKVRLLLEKED